MKYCTHRIYSVCFVAGASAFVMEVLFWLFVQLEGNKYIYIVSFLCYGVINTVKYIYVYNNINIVMCIRYAYSL